ncbi:sigma-70 family RNA polymerase sigma factor [Alteribacter populi]|uniref:sigma-70 family RNA polymerase sigma factor n=1 Tax=Alteribacter populi TaxID=2011011 RepID=UPI000BBAC186|nr:sigma-70 family RNA polymerase sigma factor [Alteribacter populi]
MYVKSGLKVYDRNSTNDQWEELYLKLSRYCYSLSQNKWDGEELAQESMFKALKYYRHKTELNAALLNKIARNLWVDTIRKQSKETITTVPETMDTKDKGMERVRSVIEDLVSKLTPKQLVIFTLTEAFQYKNTEVADALGMTETAVKGILNRTRSKLKKLSNEGTLPAVQSYWTEELQDEVTTVLCHAVHVQDPALLFKLIPKIIFPVSTPKLVFRTKIGRSHSSPSSYLSIAA